MIELQKNLLKEESIEVAESSPIIEDRTFQLAIKFANEFREKLSNDDINLIKKFNEISCEYNSNIVNMLLGYTSFLIDYSRDIIKYKFDDFTVVIAEELSYIQHTFIFSNILFLKPDICKKEKSFKSPKPFMENILAFNSFQHGSTDEKTLAHVSRLLDKNTSSINENNVKNRSIGLWLWDQYKNHYVEKIGTDEDIKRTTIAFYYGEEFLKKENELLVMKKTIKIIKDILKNKQICIDKEKLENNLLSLESMYKNNDLKTNFQDKAYSKAIDLIEKTIKIIKDVLKNEQIQICTTVRNANSKRMQVKVL